MNMNISMLSEGTVDAQTMRAADLLACHVLLRWTSPWRRMQDFIAGGTRSILLAGAGYLGVKVAAALAAAHGQRGERVFEDLLKAQELDDAQRHARVEAQPACTHANPQGLHMINSAPTALI